MCVSYTCMCVYAHTQKLRSWDKWSVCSLYTWGSWVLKSQEQRKLETQVGLAPNTFFFHKASWMLIMKPVCQPWRPGKGAQGRARFSSFFTRRCNKVEPSRASSFRKEHVCNVLHRPILPVAGESPSPRTISAYMCTDSDEGIQRDPCPSSNAVPPLPLKGKKSSLTGVLWKISLSRSHHSHGGDNVALRACGP